MTHVHAYTDGASSNNQDREKRQGGWGAILTLISEDGKRDERASATKELSGALPGGTNNQAELEAVRQVLLAMKRDGVSITIHTDSTYVIGVLARQWKPKQNVALIHDIKALMQKHTVRFEKVTGHAGVALNERADALAKAAVPAQA
jgi:ribonuclease HI